MEKVYLGLLDLNDLFVQLQNHIINHGNVSMSHYLGSDKYGFSTQYRFPIKRAFSKEPDLSSIPFLPFIGVEEFIISFLNYIKPRSTLSCCRDLEKLLTHEEILPHVEYLKYSHWSEPFQCLLGNPNGEIVKTDLLLLEDMFREVKSRLKYHKRIFNEDLLILDASRDMITVHTYGSIFKLHYLASTGGLNENAE